MVTKESGTVNKENNGRPTTEYRNTVCHGSKSKKPFTQKISLRKTK